MELFATGHNKKNALRVALAIINRQHSIEELFSIFYSGELRACQYAAMSLELIAKKTPELIYPHLDRMIAELDNPQAIQGVFRNTMRTWQFLLIPESHEGLIWDIAFYYFSEPQYALAIRVFAMTVCTNLAIKFPELAPEVMTVIEDNWDHSTAGWRSRGKRELKRLQKVIENSL